MNLVYFTQDAYKILKRDIELNKSNYYSDTPWLAEYFEENGIQEFLKKSSIIVGDTEFQYTGDDDEVKNKDDLQNTITLYSDYEGKVTPILAADPCLWATLCHTQASYKRYILKRWVKDDGSVRLEQRFFATESRASLLYYNAISRLWWSGYLTYDEEMRKRDPWKLTRTLFSAQQIQKDLFDQSFSMNKTIVKGLLRALERIQDDTGNAATPTFRKCCDSYINHYGAVTVLDILSAEEVEEIAYKYMKAVLQTD